MSETFVDRAGSSPAIWLYRLLLVWLAWWALRLGSGAVSWCWLDLVNLAFHEAGHVFLQPFGKTIHYLGGTIGQLLVPGLLAGYFLLWQARGYASAVCVWWFGENLVNVSVYMADARSLALPLVGGGDHDWNELFFRFGVLTEPAVATISGVTRGAGVLVMAAGLVWGLYFALPAPRRELLREALTSRLPWVRRALTPDPW
jgi:hypothetical protein